MIVSRLVSFILRGIQFISSIIVLGLSAHFIHRLNANGAGPRGRLIYTLIWSIISSILSLVWLLPFTASMMHYPVDFILSLGWWAAFGADYQWLHHGGLVCRGIFGVWNWDGRAHNNYCSEWKAMEAFEVIAACAFLFGGFVGIHVFHRRGRDRPARNYA